MSTPTKPFTNFPVMPLVLTSVHSFIGAAIPVLVSLGKLMDFLLHARLSN
jgi:hypothetical protein